MIKNWNVVDSEQASVSLLTDFSKSFIYLPYDLLIAKLMFMVLRESLWICRSPTLEIEKKAFA